MKIEIEVPSPDAFVFFNYLNDDEGLREGAVKQLLAQHKPTPIGEWTAIVSVLGAISRAIAIAPGFKAELAYQTAKRMIDIRRLARVG